MAVIKSRKADRMLSDAIVLDLGDLQQQADALQARARQQAEEIVAEGRAEADRLIAEASDKGYAQGYEAGLAEGRAAGEQAGREQTIDEYRTRLDALVEQWSAASQRWDSDRQSMLLQAREEVLTLALAIAEKVVYRVVEMDPTVVQDQLAEALQLITRPSKAVVTIHPDDRPAIEDVLPELLREIRQCREATIVEDPQVTRGGCVVATAGGRIDARIEQQLDRIVETLLPSSATVVDEERSGDGEPAGAAVAQTDGPVAAPDALDVEGGGTEAGDEHDDDDDDRGDAGQGPPEQTS